ncbi:hypothetical protein [Malonomonas rubra]|uniref:hypothetical protein n=1 Tax=Malonomonas rubra TaxID=57040 RepID=UPI0026ED9BFE|nr:hypothetical protein [Malonomonas rubra]
MKSTYFLLLLILIAVPVLGFPGDKLQQWQPKELSDLPGMSPAGDKYMLGANEVAGVKSVAYLNDVRKLMAKYGLQKTHHIMVTFKEISSGKFLENGKVEITVMRPDGTIAKTVSLLAMDGSFGADINLDRKGKYNFEISASLADGVKRLFKYQFVN